jgi:hypothetical protein
VVDPTAVGGMTTGVMAMHDVVIVSDNLLETAKYPEAVVDFLLDITRGHFVLAMESRDQASTRPAHEFFRRQWNVNEMRQYLTSKNATILAIHQGRLEKSSYWIVGSPPPRVPSASSSSSSSYYVHDTRMTGIDHHHHNHRAEL